MNEAERLPEVPSAAALEYAENKELFVEEVNRELNAHPSLYELLGHNPLEVMMNNHENHFKFMSNVFIFNNFRLLARTVQWVYRSYHARGFSYDYFPAVVSAYIRAVEKYMDPSNASYINRVYRWILEKHPAFIQLSKAESEMPFVMDKSWENIMEQFLGALLRGEHQDCLKITEELVSTAVDLRSFYLQVIQPAMFRIGLLWEQGDISVAQEHLATAIVSRVMASLYPRFIIVEQTKGRALISAAPNEHHELGARMVADLLELDGWDVRYLGANVPVEDLQSMITNYKPFVLGLSVGMAFNLDKASKIIASVRNNPKLQDTRIMLGGQFLHNNPEAGHSIGADGWGADGSTAVEMADKWWNEKE